MRCIARENKDDEEEERGWSDLPRDLLDLINLRLYAGETVVFRAVCKYWQSIPPLPQPPMTKVSLPLTKPDPFYQKITKSDPKLRNIPCWMNLTRTSGSSIFHHPITNAAYRVDLPELTDEVIRFSKDGWVLVSYKPESVFLFNPFTGTRIEIPEIPMITGFRSMHLSCPPTSSGCTVFGVFSNSYNEVYVGTFRHGRETWFMQLLKNNEKFLMSKCSPVLYNDLYYCLGIRGNLGVYDLTKNTWRVLGKPLDRFQKCNQSFLLESDGQLFGVFVYDDGRKIEVLRLGQTSSDLAWHKVESLEDKMFFVCYGACYSRKAAITGVGNKIYFPKFYNDGILFYSLGTKQYHSFLGNFSKKDRFGTKDMKHGVWIDIPL